MSEWASPCLQYKEVIQLLETAQGENLNQLGHLVAFFQNIEVAFDQFFRSARESGTAPDQVQASFRVVCDAVAGRRGPQHADLCEPSPFGSAHMCHLASFKQAFRVFKDRVMTFLVDFMHEYRHRMECLRTNMCQAMTTLENMRSKFAKCYKKYQLVADRLKQAYDNHDPTLELAKQGFIKAQNEAVEVHTGMNQCTAQTAMQLDSGLKEFEEVENWRSDQLREFMIVLGEWLEEFAKQIEDGNLAFIQLARLIPEVTKISEVMDCSSVIPPNGDDRFEFVRLDPRITALLDKHDIYKAEQSSGHQLYRVTADCTGHGAFLHVTKDEVVVGLSESSGNVLVKNINDSRGLVPTSALAKI